MQNYKLFITRMRHKILKIAGEQGISTDEVIRDIMSKINKERGN